ncbi:hypothetical protein HNQ91_003319 [Filimonas zeae]|uniref:hypothetical protein n=1 Tax=Filimonas zeae TaxID=1737353 RepID=UPI00166A5DE0|nr:hypothetical protein [Filimonas zeae]MDR6340254.1 hypothetical protein [Filimonas zeae]
MMLYVYYLNVRTAYVLRSYIWGIGMPADTTAMAGFHNFITRHFIFKAGGRTVSRVVMPERYRGCNKPVQQQHTRCQK